MNRSLSLVTLAGIAALASGCNWSDRAEARDAGAAVDRTYQVGAIDRIETAGPYEITVTSGGQPGVTARGGASILDETEVVVVDGVLQIRPTKKNLRWSWSSEDSKVRMAVSTAGLRGAAIAGSANNVLARDEHGYALRQLGILYAPDFVVNAGGLINVADELQGYSPERAKAKVEGIFGAVRDILHRAKADGVPTSEAADRIARDRMRDISRLRLIRVLPGVSG